MSFVSDRRVRPLVWRRVFGSRKLDPDALDGIPETDTIGIDHRGSYNIHGKRASDLAGKMREMTYSGRASEAIRTHRFPIIMKQEDGLRLRDNRHQVSTNPYIKRPRVFDFARCSLYLPCHASSPNRRCGA